MVTARLISPVRSGNTHRFLVELTTAVGVDEFDGRWLDEPGAPDPGGAATGLHDYGTELWIDEIPRPHRSGDAVEPGAAMPDIDITGVDRDTLARIVVLASRPEVVEVVAGRPDVVEVIADLVADLTDSAAVSSLIETRRRRHGLAELSTVVLDPGSGPAELIDALRTQAWVFGGQYLAPYLPDPAMLPELNGLTLPLIRADGAIHVVEPGRAYAPDLVVRDGPSGYAVGPSVVESVNRAINQLRLVDRYATEIESALAVECRRAAATVVIGLLDAAEGPGESTVRDTIRTYASHLNGIDVITYSELLSGAERALAVAEVPQLELDVWT